MTRIRLSGSAGFAPCAVLADICVRHSCAVLRRAPRPQGLSRESGPSRDAGPAQLSTVPCRPRLARRDSLRKATEG